MSNDPLKSFLVSTPDTTDPQNIPSVKAEPIGQPQAPARREPTLTTTLPTSEPVDRDAKVVSNANEVPSAPPKNKESSKKPAKPTSSKKSEPIKQTNKRKSLGTRFAIYLGFIVAAALALSITGNMMVQSMDQLRAERISANQ